MERAVPFRASGLVGCALLRLSLASITPDSPILANRQADGHTYEGEL